MFLLVTCRSAATREMIWHPHLFGTTSDFRFHEYIRPRSLSRISISISIKLNAPHPGASPTCDQGAHAWDECDRSQKPPIQREQDSYCVSNYSNTMSTASPTARLQPSERIFVYGSLMDTDVLRVLLGRVPMMQKASLLGYSSVSNATCPSSADDDQLPFARLRVRGGSFPAIVDRGIFRRWQEESSSRGENDVPAENMTFKSPVPVIKSVVSSHDESVAPAGEDGWTTSSIDGFVLTDLTAEESALLDYFEDDEYDLVEVEVETDSQSADAERTKGVACAYIWGGVTMSVVRDEQSAGGVEVQPRQSSVRPRGNHVVRSEGWPGSAFAMIDPVAWDIQRDFFPTKVQYLEMCETVRDEWDPTEWESMK